MLQQEIIQKWVRTTFGDASQEDPRERSLRFLEEAAEFVQAIGSIDKQEAIAQICEVFDRPKGKKEQEAGGVQVTFLALCANQNIDSDWALLREFERITSPAALERMQRRQAEKKAQGR